MVVGVGNPLVSRDRLGLDAAEAAKQVVGERCVLKCWAGPEHCAGEILSRLRRGGLVVVLDASPSAPEGGLCAAPPWELEQWLPIGHALPPMLVADLLGAPVVYLLLGPGAAGDTAAGPLRWLHGCVAAGRGARCVNEAARRWPCLAGDCSGSPGPL